MRKRFKWFYVSFCLSVVVVLWGGYIFDSDFSQSRAEGLTEVGGSIDTNTIWTLDGSPYIADTFTVEKGVTLTIEPGVIVSFNPRCFFIVKGDLIAIGTEADSIIFRDPIDPVEPYLDQWRGIQFDSCGTNTRFEYCLFEKYWGYEFAIECDNSSPIFSHCTFPGFTPAADTGGGIIFCKNNSSPRIEFSSMTMLDFVSACVACAIPEFVSDDFVFINQSSSNPILFHNNLYISGSYAAAGGGFLDGNYIFIKQGIGIDTSLGEPVDEIGDSIFTTNSPGCNNVDGITNPRAEPNDWQVNVKDSEKIESFNVFPNYPNPFNPSTTISFAIPEQSYITLSVYDITGQKVATLVDKHINAGSHSVIFDGSDLGSGVYLYRFESKGFSKMGKMLLLK